VPCSSHKEVLKPQGKGVNQYRSLQGSSSTIMSNNGCTILLAANTKEPAVLWIPNYSSDNRWLSKTKV